MKIFYLTPILVIVAFVKLCNGQALLVLSEASLNNSSLSQPSPAAPKPFRICSPDDELSNLYCTCKGQVVSCDFSKFTAEITKNNETGGNISGVNRANISVQPPEHVELVLYGYTFPPNASRFCVCNSPPNVHLTFTQDHFLPFEISNKFQRFDLFNLSGITHFQGGFSVNFHGDLYISNVSRIPEIAENEFGRGKDEPTFNVQDKECCSPIKVNQDYEKPVMFIENSTIDLVRRGGLNNDHLWKTVILKSNVFNAVEQFGINFNNLDSGCNIAILNGLFKNVSSLGLLFQDTANLLLARNEFRRSNGVPSYFFKSVSHLNNSNIILMGNLFWNVVYLNLDAEHVVSWYNKFDVWYNETFSQMKYTAFQKGSAFGNSGRIVSLRYNIIDNSPILQENALDFGNDSTVSLSDNVLGSCDCSTNMNISKTIKPERNWCYSGIIWKRDGKCLIKLDAALNHCKKSQSVNFEQLCEEKQISVPAASFPGVGANLTKEFGEMHINSAFLTRIVKEFHSSFGGNHAALLRKILVPVKDTSTTGSNKVPSHDNQHNENSGIISNPVKGDSNIPAAKSTIVVPILITLIVTAFIGILGFLMYKNKHRLLHIFGQREIIDESYNQMI